MKDSSNEERTAILDQYGIRAKYVEQYGRTWKIYSDNGIYALKKILPQSGIDFVRNVQLLYQRGYNRIVPIYPTLDGRYAILQQNYLYYLMPWLSNEEKEERNEKHQKMFRELARLHTLSMKNIEIEAEERKAHFENTLDEWEREEEFLTEFLETSEKKWYMSPFELLFCMFNNDIRRAHDFAKQKLTEWYENSKEVTTGRTVITHGKISTEHFLYDDRGYGYFSNFENSKIASPLQDLLPFLSRTLKTYPKRMDECIDWLYTYFGHFPFREEEKLLFLSYLAHPGPIFRTVQAYRLQRTKKTEIKFVKELQYNYWLLKNTEYIVIRMNEMENRAKQEAEPKPKD
ncbi:spore coat protein YsxE [Bacillus sp. FJAT-49736]|uniref:spore coat protein YsxE n=1 Tax=Bacillus sp. FJAT-49736 TaxID=2833582 RepID=UPI001BC8ED91|nr:spore coat protein YsxE [Bacillus sp. FJAT-49736]MBS4173722.1 spore coat protein YsxE [Bacillus sp. FJAT-49736]